MCSAVQLQSWLQPHGFANRILAALDQFNKQKELAAMVARVAELHQALLARAPACQAIRHPCRSLIATLVFSHPPVLPVILILARSRMWSSKQVLDAWASLVRPLLLIRSATPIVREVTLHQWQSCFAKQELWHRPPLNAHLTHVQCQELLGFELVLETCRCVDAHGTCICKVSSGWKVQ